MDYMCFIVYERTVLLDILTGAIVDSELACSIRKFEKKDNHFGGV